VSEDQPPSRVERLRELAKMLKSVEAENLSPSVVLAVMNSLISIMLEFVDDPTGVSTSVPNETMRLAFVEIAKRTHGRSGTLRKWLGATKKKTPQQAIILSISTQVLWLSILMIGMLGRTGIANDLGFTDEELSALESLASERDDER